MWWIRELGVGARARCLMFEWLLSYASSSRGGRDGGSRSRSRVWVLCVRDLCRHSSNMQIDNSYLPVHVVRSFLPCRLRGLSLSLSQ